MEREIILYGAGPNAERLARYVGRRESENRVVCFAVTEQGSHILDGLPVYQIQYAVSLFPGAEIWIAAQEKHHAGMEGTLRTLGKSASKRFGFRDVSALLGQEGIQQIQKGCPGVAVAEDGRDYSTLNIRTGVNKDRLFKLFPLGAIPMDDAALGYIKRDGMSQDLEGLFGRYPVLDSIDASAWLDEKRLFLGMASSCSDQILRETGGPEPWLHRIYGGAIGLTSEKKRELTSVCCFDDEGWNISPKNRDYGELSVTYWMWKNITDHDYLGLCHYRRRFALGRAAVALIEQGEVDAILTVPRLAFPSVRDVFLGQVMTSLTAEDYIVMLHAVEHAQGPAWQDFVSRAFAGKLYCPNNMVIAKREIFSAYCQWLFSILETAEAEYCGSVRNDRYLAYMGEMLTGMYFARYHDKYRLAFCEYELLN